MTLENKSNSTAFIRDEILDPEAARKARFSGKPSIEELARTLTPAQLSRLERGPHLASLAAKNRSRTAKISP